MKEIIFIYSLVYNPKNWYSSFRLIMQTIIIVVQNLFMLVKLSHGFVGIKCLYVFKGDFDRFIGRFKNCLYPKELKTQNLRSCQPACIVSIIKIMLILIMHHTLQAASIEASITCFIRFHVPSGREPVS